MEAAEARRIISLPANKRIVHIGSNKGMEYRGNRNVLGRLNAVNSRGTEGQVQLFNNHGKSEWIELSALRYAVSHNGQALPPIFEETEAPSEPTLLESSIPLPSEQPPEPAEPAAPPALQSTPEVPFNEDVSAITDMHVLLACHKRALQDAEDAKAMMLDAQSRAARVLSRLGEVKKQVDEALRTLGAASDLNAPNPFPRGRESTLAKRVSNHVWLGWIAEVLPVGEHISPTQLARKIQAAGHVSDRDHKSVTMSLYRVSVEEHSTFRRTGAGEFTRIAP